MNFPTTIGQRVRVSYETGVTRRGESGIIESLPIGKGKMFKIKFLDGQIQEVNKIYLKVIDFLTQDQFNEINFIKPRTIEFIFGELGDKNNSISNIRSVLGGYSVGHLSVEDIRELAIIIYKAKCKELKRELIWD